MDRALEAAIRKALEFLLDEHRDEGPVLEPAEVDAARRWLTEHPEVP